MFSEGGELVDNTCFTKDESSPAQEGYQYNAPAFPTGHGN
jgi:hypothetical protein